MSNIGNKLYANTSHIFHTRHTSACKSYIQSKNSLANRYHNTFLLSPQYHRPAFTPRVSPFDQAWGTSLDFDSVNQVLPQNLFAFSLFPYIGFLYHLTKSKQTPPLTLFGFYFLLVFVFATIPAGIYAKKVYGTSLANVDYLHGCAEFMLTLTNLFIVLGLRKAIRNANATSENNAETVLYDSSSTSTAPRPSNTDATTDV